MARADGDVPSELGAAADDGRLETVDPLDRPLHTAGPVFPSHITTATEGTNTA